MSQPGTDGRSPRPMFRPRGPGPGNRRTVKLALTPSEADDLASAMHALCRHGIGGESMRCLAYAILGRLPGGVNSE